MRFSTDFLLSITLGLIASAIMTFQPSVLAQEVIPGGITMEHHECLDTTTPCTTLNPNSVCAQANVQCTYCSHYYRFDKGCFDDNQRDCIGADPETGDNLGCGHNMLGWCVDIGGGVFECQDPVDQWQQDCDDRAMCETKKHPI